VEARRRMCETGGSRRGGARKRDRRTKKIGRNNPCFNIR
jgi:hypothetical protein